MRKELRSSWLGGIESKLEETIESKLKRIIIRFQ